MTCRKMYETALKLIGEPVDNTGTSDYLLRAPSLMSIIMLRFAYISDALTGTKTDPDELIIHTVDSLFPLDSRLYSAASLALGSLLILNEIPKLAEYLEVRAQKEADKAANEATVVGSTKEVYGS